MSNIQIIRVLEEENGENGQWKKISKFKKNFPNWRTKKFQNQRTKALKVLSNIQHNEWKRPASRHIAMKLHDTNDKEKIFQNTPKCD